jgi:hypothetical protein
MSVHCAYRFVAEATSHQGEPLGMLPLAPDFEPALQGCQLEGMRQGRLPLRMRYGPGGEIAPIWDPGRGQPYVAGARASLEAPDGGRFCFDVRKPYFQAAVETASSALVEGAKLAAGERFTYRLCAFPQPQPGTRHDPPAENAFTVEAIPQPLHVAPGAIALLLRSARPRSTDVAQEADLPVFIDAAVLGEAAELARQAADVETGGILVGQLHRDGTRSELFARINAQIPAPHTRSSRARLTFTPDTWSAVRAAIALRARDEIYLGWWHYHPHFCKQCPPERRRNCLLSAPFFSDEDRALHRTVFGRGFDLALLLSDLGMDELSYDLFGWRQGLIAARSFFALP